MSNRTLLEELLTEVSKKTTSCCMEVEIYGKLILDCELLV
jgi:hypothetical protein